MTQAPVSPQPEVSTRPIATTLDLVQAVIALAEAYPDATYVPLRDDLRRASCCYTSGEVLNGPPGCLGCLIGQAAWKLSPAAFAQSEYDDTPAHDLAIAICGRQISGELDWLTEVQCRQDEGMPWLRAIETADAKYGRPGVKSQCNRCGTDMVVNFCSDETCPFSNHEQHCPAGWTGHPEHPLAESTSCTCRTAAARGVFTITAAVSKEEPLGGPVGYGNAYISLYPVLLSGKPPGQLFVGQRCQVRYGMHPNMPATYWIERIS